MNFKTITTVIVAVLVVVILTAVTIIPVVQSAQGREIEVTKTNGDPYYRAGYTTDTVSIQYDSESAYSKINGMSPHELTGRDNLILAYIYTDTIMVTLRQEFGAGVSYIQSPAITHAQRVPLNSEFVSVTFENGTCTLTNSKADATWTSYSIPYTFLMIPNPEGDYAVYLSGALNTKSINEESRIFASYSTQMGGYGTVTDFTAAYGGSFQFTTVDNEDGTYSISNVTQNGTNLGSGGLVSIPMQYTVLEEDTSITAMLGIIPLLALVLPIVMIARAFASGRD